MSATQETAIGQSNVFLRLSTKTLNLSLVHRRTETTTTGHRPLKSVLTRHFDSSCNRDRFSGLSYNTSGI